MRRWMAAGVVGVTSLACGGAFEETQHALDAGDHAVLVEIADLKGEFPSLVVDPTANGGADVFITLLPAGETSCPNTASFATYGAGKAGQNGVPTLTALS